MRSDKISENKPSEQTDQSITATNIQNEETPQSESLDAYVSQAEQADLYVPVSDASIQHAGEVLIREKESSDTLKGTTDTLDEQSEVVNEPKIKKGWKTFWVVMIILVLSCAFLYVGARWPSAYVVWFGISAILALFNISSSVDGGPFKERLPVVLAFLFMAAFYLWLEFLMPTLFVAIMLELALLGFFALIGLVFTLWEARRKKRLKESNN